MNVNAILTNDQDKETFLKGLIRLSRLDGVIAVEEQQFFINCAVGFGLSMEKCEELKKLLFEPELKADALAINFDTSIKKMFFFMEAIQLCNIDGVYSEDEKLEIRKIAEEMSVSLSNIEKVEAWVEEGIVWKNKGDSLIELPC